jgi:methyltransferase family protein
MPISLGAKLKNSGRIAIMRAGRRGGRRLQRRTETLDRFAHLGVWAASVGDRLPKHWHDRYDLFREGLRHVHGDAPLYLEFGVYRGDTLRWWCENLTAPGARFVGFDSFEGLPEDWHAHVKAGAFALDDIPELPDPRASFEVGWFDKTVPAFEVPPHDQLIINIDSDLYSSAVVVLDAIEPHLVPGTLIYFDELGDINHELRAWREFLDRTAIRVEPIGMSNGGINWMFRVIA